MLSIILLSVFLGIVSLLVILIIAGVIPVPENNDHSHDDNSRTGLSITIQHTFPATGTLTPRRSFSGNEITTATNSSVKNRPEVLTQISNNTSVEILPDQAQVAIDTKSSTMIGLAVTDSGIFIVRNDTDDDTVVIIQRWLGINLNEASAVTVQLPSRVSTALGIQTRGVNDRVYMAVLTTTVNEVLVMASTNSNGSAWTTSIYTALGAPTQLTWADRFLGFGAPCLSVARDGATAEQLIANLDESNVLSLESILLTNLPGLIHGPVNVSMPEPGTAVTYVVGNRAASGNFAIRKALIDANNPTWEVVMNDASATGILFPSKFGLVPGNGVMFARQLSGGTELELGFITMGGDSPVPPTTITADDNTPRDAQTSPSGAGMVTARGDDGNTTLWHRSPSGQFTITTIETTANEIKLEKVTSLIQYYKPRNCFVRLVVDIEHGYTSPSLALHSLETGSAENVGYELLVTGILS